MSEATVRQATLADHDAVAAFTADTWSDRDVGDYIPDVFPEWVESDGPDQHTVVADVDGEAAGVCQAVVLSEWEAWLQGMRVDPAHRGAGLGLAMVEHLFSWCRDQGASVARNMVFSWNDAGLGQSRRAGFEPRIEGRWAMPTPDGDSEVAVTDDADAAWAYWQRSDARDHLGGLALDPEESWALSTLTRERLAELPTITVREKGRPVGTTARVRTVERDGETWAVYGHSAWRDGEAAEALFGAIARDAADQGAEATRVLIPETPRHVSDVALTRANAGDEPIFVLEADL